MNNTKSDLEKCEKRIGYRFHDRRLLKISLTHSSCSDTHLQSNERLEFLGDAVLNLVTTNMLYRRFPLKKEGEMTRLKSTIVSRNACRRVALRLGLDKYILIGKTLSSIPDSLVSNVMEAVIGAIFLDGGFEEARLFIEENFQKEVATALNVEINRNSVHNLQVTKPTGLPEDYKTILQTLIQKEASKPTYKYVNLEEIGPSHSKCFKYAVEIDEKQYQAAWGKSKKEAQQRAAGNAIHQIQGQEPIFDDQLQK